MLEKTADGGFTLGPRIWQLARVANQHQDGGNATQMVMQTLSRRTRETIALSHLFDRTAVCIDSIESAQTVRINVERGQIQPLHATAASKVLLAHVPEEAWDSYLAEPLEAFTTHTITDPQVLKTQLRQIREQGYGISEDEIELGVRAIAVPVLDRKNDRVLALAVVGPTFRLNDQLVGEYRELLQAAATAIQAQTPGTLR